MISPLPDLADVSTQALPPRERTMLLRLQGRHRREQVIPRTVSSRLEVTSPNSSPSSSVSTTSTIVVIGFDIAFSNQPNSLNLQCLDIVSHFFLSIFPLALDPNYSPQSVPSLPFSIRPPLNPPRPGLTRRFPPILLTLSPFKVFKYCMVFLAMISPSSSTDFRLFASVLIHFPSSRSASSGYSASVFMLLPTFLRLLSPARLPVPTVLLELEAGVDMEACCLMVRASAAAIAPPSTSAPSFASSSAFSSPSAQPPTS